MGALATSRAFGDTGLKKYGVSAEPDFVRHSITANNPAAFMVRSKIAINTSDEMNRESNGSFTGACNGWYHFSNDGPGNHRLCKYLE